MIHLAQNVGSSTGQKLDPQCRKEIYELSVLNVRKIPLVERGYISALDQTKLQKIRKEFIIENP